METDSARTTSGRWFHRDVAIVSFIVFVFVSGLNGVLIFRSHGGGRIVARINRGGGAKGPNGRRLAQGLFVRTDSGAELRIPSALFDRARAGQRIEKRAGSWTYWVDGKPWSAAPSIVLDAALVGAVSFLALSVLAAVTGWARRG